MPAPVARVIFLGLDGGTMTVLRPWFERGKLPNLSAFWRRSATGTLKSTLPMVTPVAWSSFLTGCQPKLHGVHEFGYVTPNGRNVKPCFAGELRVPTLWQILDNARRPVVSLNLAMSWPSHERHGLIVGGAEAPGADAAFRQCPDFGREVMATVPDFTHRLVWKRRPRTLDELEDRARRNIAVFHAQARVAELADSRTDWSALMVHFHNLDGIEHRLWPYLDVDDTSIIEPGWNEAVERCLTALDESVGRLLELAAKRDAAVVAVSDHGFGPCRKVIQINQLLQDGGFQIPAGRRHRLRHRLARVRDRFRRWRARKATGEDVKVPKLVRALVCCNGSRTLAYAPFGELSGHIYLNPRAVRPGPKADRIRSEIVEFLADARNPETGLSLFEDVHDVGLREDLDPLEHGMPEILACCRDGFHVDARLREGRPTLAHDPGLPGTHYRDGIIAVDAPGVRVGEYLVAELADLAPTTLTMLGLPVPGHMDGRVLHEAFEEPLPLASWPARHAAGSPRPVTLTAR